MDGELFFRFCGMGFGFSELVEILEFGGFDDFPSLGLPASFFFEDVEDLF